MLGFKIAAALSTVLVVASLIIFFYLMKKKPHKDRGLLTPLRIFALGIFLAGFTLFIPLYSELFAGQPIFAQIWETIWVSVHHTIRLFIIDTGFEEILAASVISDTVWYAVIGTVLFILAPITTAGVILSFFRNLVSYAKCFFHRSSDVFVFSELSKKSLALATDLQKNHKKALLIFTDVFGEDNEEAFELGEQAREIGAVSFRVDMATLNLGFLSKSSSIYFFAIGEDESENVKQAFELSRDDRPYAKRENVFIYVFSTDVEGELLLSNVPKTKIRLRRVDDIRSLVYRNLYDSGDLIFSNAVPAEDGNKLIRAFVIGVGGHGREMLKALTWFCQMDGYRIEIHAFELDPLAEKKFKHIAPGLISPENNGVYVAGEAQYKIVFHNGVSVDDARFEEALETAGTPTYVFISLGEDARNVRTAVYLRQYFRQKHMPDPIIQAIVYDSKNQNVLNTAKNFKGQSYGIAFVGAREEMYSESVILGKDLETEALKTHTRYGDTEENFYRFEYCYRSSMSSALHDHLRSKLHIADFDNIETVTEEQRDQSERIEHRRWNAYMRSEGFVYSGSTDKASRDDLAKMHHNLVPFDALSEEDKRKDSAVAIGKK